MKVESVYRHLQLGEVSKIDLSVETQWIEEWARLSGLYVVFLHVDARLQNAQMKHSLQQMVNFYLWDVCRLLTPGF